MSEKSEKLKVRNPLAGPKQPRGKEGAQNDGADQIGENLRAGTQGVKELAWTLTHRKLKFSSHAQ